MSTTPTAAPLYPVAGVGPAPADSAANSILVNTAGLPGKSANLPAYSGTFIPQIWSSKLIARFYESTVLAAIANTDYEGKLA